MAPPLPPELMDDLIGEILLRMPPAEPACLVRASLVCKRWRSLVLDHGFVRQYRAFHRTAPVMGFFHDQQCWCYDRFDDVFVPRFVAVATTTSTQQAPPSLPQPAASAGAGRPGGRTVSAAKGPIHSCRTLDCRHGRVLLHTMTVLWPSQQTLTVWDPVVTGDHKSFSPPSDIDPNCNFFGVVLCASAAASDGCGGCDRDHTDCSGGPFLVVIAGVDHGVDYDEDGVAWARVYSSETAAWGEATTLDDVESFVYDAALPSVVTGGAAYFMLDSGTRILKYDLAAGGARLSVMNAPPAPPRIQGPNIIFAAAQDGELGVAIVEGYSLHLWSWDAGVGDWARVKVIQLDNMIPISIGDPSTEFDLAGFAQGAGLIYISANDDHHTIFTVELKSGHITKTGKTRNSSKIFPLTSFCTPRHLYGCTGADWKTTLLRECCDRC